MTDLVLASTKPSYVVTANPYRDSPSLVNAPSWSSYEDSLEATNSDAIVRVFADISCDLMGTVCAGSEFQATIRLFGLVV